jgi:amino acid adenylation domain-containing protein
VDQQVKIRGYRIETGEIEVQLSAHEAVRDVVVVSRDDDGDKRLVAYVVAQSRGSSPIGDLRRYLRDRLPEYMVPTSWVLLDQLPLTPNGKVDRKALPEPGRARLDSGQSFVAPQTLIEEVLATIWKEVLRLDVVGRDDNFFWLGGHSLLATQIVSRVRESFQVELPLRVIFEAPTLVELSERIDAAMRAGSALIAPPLQKLSDNGELLPLSYAQQRLWFLDQLMPGSNAYNIPAEMYIKADVKVGALEQALNEVLRRHEALRTTFFVSGSQPAQRVNPAKPVSLPLIDLRSLDETERSAEVDRLRQEDALRPFDLGTGPLLRANLIRINNEHYLLLMNMHHIVSDAWSMGVLLHEMQTLYEAFSHGQPSPLAELEIQYSDYARWQRDWLQGEVLQQEVNYWKQQLDGVPTLLELDTNQPRQLLRKISSARCEVSFSEKLSRSLREFSSQEGATLFMTLMAGFHALLRRYTGQKDILIGTPIAGRDHVELEPLIGFLVNMIPIRTSFNDALTFRDLLKQVRESSFAAYTHQDLPFDKLVEELQPKRAPGRNPIFQAILAFENAAPEMEIATVNLPVGVPVNADVKFDLEVHLTDTPDGIRGAFVYSPELFEPALIARMVDHFERLFERTMSNPDKELRALSLLDQAEYRQVVEEWNDTAVAFPDASCIHEIFEQEVEQRGDAIAVEFNEENVTYRELNRRVNVLAHELRRQGVGPEVFVGVMLERSVDLIVTLLAVAKAGGVYVPLNLAEPSPRLKFILKDSGVAILVTSKHIADRMPETSHLTVVCVDTDEFRNAEFAANPVNTVGPDNLAYLMYTSGSTGNPKGVCISHRNILGLVKSANYAELNSDEIFLQFSPISFDASTFEIWACLLNGARLVMFPPGTPSLSEMGEFISRTQVTTLFLTTGLFHQFIDADLGSIGAVRQLLTGGDALSSTHLSKALEQIEHCQFVNCYGPTESTVMVCCYRVTPDYSATAVPIGRPISNSRVYIINGMQPVSIGERGELFVSGAGLGRGYHNRPELTAEQFLPDPYGPWPGGRLYRTGDAARYLNNGLIQFLGRVDDQLKISGYRIEPGEIESALLEHPEVRAALVLAHEDTPGDKRLVAYVVANPEQTPSNEELRTHLRERVPEYMVPSLFVLIDEMPLTLHGKVDKAALPAPQVSLSRVGGREYVAPRNGLQQQLVDIWEELFKLHPIGVTDNFFELGGHSLQMIMLIARVEERLGKRVTMAEVFNDPTIEHMSQLIGHGKEKLLQSLLVPLQSEGTKPTLFSPHASGGHVWCYKELVQHIGQDQPFYGVQARQPDQGPVFHTQIEAMASDYVEAIRSVQPHGPYLLAGWSMGGVIAFEMARQFQAQGEEIAMLALMDANASDGNLPEFKWGVLLSIFAVDLGLNLQNLSTSVEEILALPPMAQLRQVWKEAKLAGLVPSDMTLVEFRRVFDIFKINAKTLGSYKTEEFRGRITLFSPEQDIEERIFSHDEDHLDWKAKNPNSTDPLKGWDKVATEGVELVVVPGDHFTMMREPHVEVLAQELRTRIQGIVGTKAVASTTA